MVGLKVLAPFGGAIPFRQKLWIWRYDAFEAGKEPKSERGNSKAYSTSR